MSDPQAHASLDYASPERYIASRRVTLVSVAANLLLAVAQIVIGVIGHSQALVADGFHTLSDLITDAMVLFALKHGRKEADAEHPYGHGRIETAVTMILGVMLLAVAIGIAARAGLRLLSGEEFQLPAVITLWVALGTLVAKEAMYHYTMRTARRYDSNMLRANAWHHRSDAVSSLIVVAGIAGSLYGFGYLDAVAAVIVAVMVGKIGIELGWQALRELVDTGLDEEDLAVIRQAILSIPEVKELHLLRTRRVAGRALVDVHIIVDERLSVSEGHQISETVRSRLIREIAPVADVMVHIDTEEDVDRRSCAHLPLRSEVERRLADYFRDIPEAGQVEHTVLHYVDGRIQVELRLPLAAVADRYAAERLRARFREAVRPDPDIGDVEVSFS